MKITKKLATKLHEGARRKNKKISVICVICGFIFFLIITLGLSSPVYTKSRKPELKGKSNSYSSKPSTQSKPQYKSRPAPSGKPSRSSPPPRLENKNRSGGWGKSANQGKSSKLERKTGTVTRKPGRNFRQQDQNRQKRSPGGHINRNRDHRKQHPQYYGNNSCVTYPYGERTRYYDEEYVESPDSEYPPASRESNGLPAGQEREYHINDSFSFDPVLVEKIDEYNAKNQIGLEYPLTRWSASLTYQLLDSLELIEHMEKKIHYYKQQMDAVRNSKLSPAEKEIWERFWLERIERLQESKQKEENRVSELRSEIEEENKKSE